jgi:hypothetical protein
VAFGEAVRVITNCPTCKVEVSYIATSIVTGDPVVRCPEGHEVARNGPRPSIVIRPLDPVAELVAPTSRVYCAVPVLPWLVGEPWDTRALDWIMSLRPTSVRVNLPRSVPADTANPWRVTVNLDVDHRILYIMQEIEVGGSTFDTGGAAMTWLRERARR